MARTVGRARLVSWPQERQYVPGAAAPQLRHSGASAGGGGEGEEVSVTAGRASDATREQLVDARQDAAQDIDLFLFQAGAREQPAQPRQQSLRLSGIEEAHADERALGAGVERLDFVQGRRFELRSRPHTAAARGDEELV